MQRSNRLARTLGATIFIGTALLMLGGCSKGRGLVFIGGGYSSGRHHHVDHRYHDRPRSRDHHHHHGYGHRHRDHHHRGGGKYRY